MAVGKSNRLFIFIVLHVPIITIFFRSFNNSSKEDSIFQQHSLLCQAFHVEFGKEKMENCENYDCGSYQNYDDVDLDENNGYIDDSNNAEDEEDEEEELEKKSDKFITKVHREWRK